MANKKSMDMKIVFWWFHYHHHHHPPHHHYYYHHHHYRYHHHYHHPHHHHYYYYYFIIIIIIPPCGSIVIYSSFVHHVYPEGKSIVFITNLVGYFLCGFNFTVLFSLRPLDTHTLPIFIYIYIYDCGLLHFHWVKA